MNRGLENRSYEDPLTYLPRKPILEFSRGKTIYDPHQPGDHLYVVILGRVKITSIAEEGFQTVARIICAEGLFGESCLIGTGPRSESAIALDNVTLMAWSAAEIEQQIEREPRLGIALSQHMVRQCIELQDRIESMAVHKTPERVMLALLQLALDLGTPTADGAIRVPSLTHHTIAEYVGTSREIVTFQMNRLRRLGLIRYSRKFIDIYALAVRDTLRQHGVTVPQTVRELTQQAGG